MKFFTLKEVADMLAYSTETVRMMCVSGELEHFRPAGKAYRISEQSLKSYLEKNTWHGQEKNQGLSDSEGGTISTSVMDETLSVRILQVGSKLNGS